MPKGKPGKVKSSCHPSEWAHGNGLCKKCWTREDYIKNKEAKLAYQEANREHRSGYMKSYYANNKRAHMDRSLRKLYGISVDVYELLLKLQNNVCAICDNPCSSGRRLAVDHNHRTGMIRGLLCQSCNHAVGLLDDDPNRATRLAIYLLTANISAEKTGRI